MIKKTMSKFTYSYFQGWNELVEWTNSKKENTNIRKLKKMGLKPEVLALNIMGQEGWELISTPIMGAQTIVLKKNLK